MKKFLACFFLFALTLSSVAYSGETNKVYVYPTLFQDSYWKDHNETDAIKAAQLPDEYIKGASTYDLFLSLLNNPLMPTIGAYENLTEGFQAKIAHWNGFKQLLERKDLAEIFIRIYRENPEVKVNKTMEQQNLYFKQMTLDIFINQKEIFTKFDDAQKMELKGLIYQKYEQKKQNGFFDWYIEAFEDRIAAESEIASEELQTYSLSGLPPAPWDDGSYPMPIRENGTIVNPKLKTQNGTELALVYDQRNVKDFNQYEKDLIAGYLASILPSGLYKPQKVADATMKYNCHSYSFLNRSTSNYYWFTLDPAAYFEDKSYSVVQTGDCNLAKNNDVVYYGNWHTGVVAGMLTNSTIHGVEYTPIVTSKFGSWGLYTASLNSNPYCFDGFYYGSNSKILRR